MPDIDQLSEQAARMLVRAALQALREIDDYLSRRMIMGGKVNVKYLADTTTELQRLIEQSASRAVSGDFSDAMARAARMGVQNLANEVDSGEGVTLSMATIDQGQIQIALYNAKVKLKDALQPAVKIVNDNIAAAMVAGTSMSDLSDKLRKQLNGLTAMTEQRAGLIAHSELMSVYRMQSLNVGKKLGLDYYQYTGPSDGRTEPICLAAMDVIATKEEWLRANPLVFQYGLHYGCRHELIPVIVGDRKSYKKKIGSVSITAVEEV